MIQRRIDTDISNWVLLSKENFITFEFKAIAKHIEKSDISLDDAGKIIINCSILEIPDSFLVQCRKNQMLYWPSRSCSSKNNISFFSQALQIATVSINSKTAKTMHFGHIYNGHAILWATLQSIGIWIDISYNEILYFVLYNIIFYIDTTQYCISIAWFDKIILYHIILIAVFDFNMMI